MARRLERDSGYLALCLVATICLLAIGWVSFTYFFRSGYEVAIAEHQQLIADRERGAQNLQRCISSNLSDEQIAKCVLDAEVSFREDERSESDLLAQKAMAFWAEMTLWTTFGVGLLSMILTGIGIWFVKRTLDETAIANATARSAINQAEEMGRTQLRPWLSFNDYNVYPAHNFTTELGTFEKAAVVIMSWINTGQSPAVRCSFFNAIRVVPEGAPAPFFIPPAIDGNGVLGPNRISETSMKPIVGEDFDGVLAGTHDVIFFTQVDYYDSLGGDALRNTQLCLRIKLNGVMVDKRTGEEHPQFQAYVDGPQNRCI